MDEFAQIFRRANMQCIRGFLQYGTETKRIINKGYSERMREAYNSLDELISMKYPEYKSHGEIMEKIVAYAVVVEDVYMEVGLQCGLILGTEMRQNGKPVKEER